MSSAVEKLIKTLIDCQFATRDEIVGCSERDIAILEVQFSLTLPAVYKEFLSKMGMQAGEFEGDALWTCTSLVDARERAESMLNIAQRKRAESEDEGNGLQPLLQLRPTDFVFLIGGNNFLYFDTTRGDDPPVELFDLSDDEPNYTYESFSDWLQSMIDGYLESFEELQGAGAESP